MFASRCCGWRCACHECVAMCVAVSCQAACEDKRGGLSRKVTELEAAVKGEELKGRRVADALAELGALALGGGCGDAGVGGWGREDREAGPGVAAACLHGAARGVGGRAGQSNLMPSSQGSAAASSSTCARNAWPIECSGEPRRRAAVTRKGRVAY